MHSVVMVTVIVSMSHLKNTNYMISKVSPHNNNTIGQ